MLRTTYFLLVTLLLSPLTTGSPLNQPQSLDLITNENLMPAPRSDTSTGDSPKTLNVAEIVLVSFFAVVGFIVFATCSCAVYKVWIRPNLPLARAIRRILEQQRIEAEREQMKRDTMSRGQMAQGVGVGVNSGGETMEVNQIGEARVPGVMSVQT